VNLRVLIRWLGLDKPQESRPCPHCNATIGWKDNVCPQCHRILRFEGITELREGRSGKDEEAA
jgi:hypothetical protein